MFLIMIKLLNNSNHNYKYKYKNMIYEKLLPLMDTPSGLNNIDCLFVRIYIYILK
jgi:hypothetical protein